jgi:AraC-like DNA-binding protein
MLKSILLLTPIYITFFWAVVLHTDKKKQSKPRLFLGKFMIIAFLVYISHFIYFSGLEQAYLIIDPIYHFASLLVFPLYHIYFRLLTIDSEFSIKKHSVYLIAPVLLSALYMIAVQSINYNEYSNLVFGHGFESKSNALRFLNIIKILMSICFIAQVIFTVIANFKLIMKFGIKATQYYSDIEDISTVRVHMLNYSMVFTGIASIVLASLGRGFFNSEYPALAIAGITFSSMLFIIGWLGDRQKTLNPTFEKEDVESETNHCSLEPAEQELLKKITWLFENEKVYLNSKLNIMDIASAVGSNRTYISYLINKSFDQNFCSFVNQYRIKELETKILEQPNAGSHSLSEQCGFGSIDSMKRSVQAKSGLCLKEWRNSL